MAQLDTSMAIADSITEQYAGVMDDLIKENADLQRQLAVALQVRDAAIADRDTAVLLGTQARCERDEARADVRVPDPVH